MNVKTIIENIPTGITEPYFGILENDEYVILKVNNNNENNLTLINEYVLYNLAIHLKICMPKSGIAYVDDNTKIEENVRIENKNLGPCFFSTRIDRANLLNEETINLIENQKDLIRMILFDHIIYNKDRNPGNLIVAQVQQNILVYIIDHSHALKNGPVWNKCCFYQGIENEDYKDTEIMEHNKYIYNIILNSEKFMDIIKLETTLNNIKLEFEELYSDFNYDEVLSDIPDMWKIEFPDILEIEGYIDYRMDHIDEIVELILNYVRRCS